MLEPKAIDIGDVLRDLVRFTIRDYRIYLLITLFTVGPLTFATNWLTARMQTAVPSVTDMLTLIGIFGVSAMISLMVFGLLIFIGYSRMRGRSISVSDAAGNTAKRFFRLLLSALVFGLTLFVGFIACCVPGLFLLSALYPILAVSVVEDHSVLEIPSRAWDLTDGNRWRIFAIAMILMVVNYMLQIPIFVMLAASPSNATAIYVLVAVKEVLVTPFMAMSVTAVYLHLRRAVDNLDAEDVAEVFA